MEESNNIKKGHKEISKKYSKCMIKCGWKSYHKKWRGRRGSKEKVLTPQQKKQREKEGVKSAKCSKLCYKERKTHRRNLKKTFKKEFREINKEKQKKCCKCRYIKQKGKLYKVKGPWRHCSYDSSNCCRDKRTIVPKTKYKRGGRTRRRTRRRTGI